MRIQLVLNPSIMSMMTKDSSYGWFVPLASSFQNRMYILVFLLRFKGGVLWKLFTSLCCDFLRDLKNPLVDDSSSDRLYLSYHPLWTIMRILLILGIRLGLLLTIVFRSAGLALFHKLLQLPFTNQFFYLLLKVPTIFSVMAMILKEAIVFPFIPYIGWGLK